MDNPGNKAGEVMVVEFTVLGIPCIGLNGGPIFPHSEAFSFQVATDTQEETERYWNAIGGNGGKESECGWCKDKWGVNWQITPRTLTAALAAGGVAAAWRRQPKWVVSRTLRSVGPNASLFQGDLEHAVRKLKADHDGEIEVAGPALAASLTEMGLIDEYRIYLHPVVLGCGTPYFAKPRPPLRLIAHDLIEDDVIRLRYRPD